MQIKKKYVYTNQTESLSHHDRHGLSNIKGYETLHSEIYKMSQK